MDDIFIIKLPSALTFEQKMWLSNHRMWGEGGGSVESLPLIEFCSFDPGLGFCEEGAVYLFQAACLYLSMATRFILILLFLAHSPLPSRQNFCPDLTFLLPFPEVIVTLRQFPRHSPTEI